MNIMKFFKKKKHKEMPYERGIVVSSAKSIEIGFDNQDIQKWIFIMEGNKIAEKIPYSASAVKVVQEVMHIPVYEPTKKEIFFKGEDVIPSEVRYEAIQ